MPQRRNRPLLLLTSGRFVVGRNSHSSHCFFHDGLTSRRCFSDILVCLLLPCSPRGTSLCNVSIPAKLWHPCENLLLKTMATHCQRSDLEEEHKGLASCLSINCYQINNVLAAWDNANLAITRSGP